MVTVSSQSFREKLWKGGRIVLITVWLGGGDGWGETNTPTRLTTVHLHTDIIFWVFLYNWSSCNTNFWP